MAKVVRARATGMVYPYSETFANHPGFEVVDDTTLKDKKETKKTTTKKAPAPAPSKPVTTVSEDPDDFDLGDLTDGDL